MNKYDEIMEKIVVTEEMRSRILTSIKKSAPEANNKKFYLPDYRKYLPAAACLAFFLLGAVVIPNVLKEGRTEPPVMEQAFVYADNAEELSSYVGFSVNELSSLPFEATEIAYLSYGEELAEITYMNEEQTLCYRKSVGAEDNSGDYNTYSTQMQITVKDFPILLKGNDTLYNLAVWNDEQYSYSIYAEKGLSKDELSVLIETLIW